MNTTIATILEYKGTQVYSVPSTTTVLDAVREMNKRNIGSLLVMDGGRLMGIFSARDIMRNVVAQELEPRSTHLHEVMRTEFARLTLDMDAEQAMEIFEQQHCRHLPVLDEGLVVGLISIGDISRWCSTAHRAETESLHNYIQTGLNL
jgi:CBS domain-containing protein